MVGSQCCVSDGNKNKKECNGKVMEKIKFVNGLVVPSEGRSGGLAMLWKREVQLEIMGYSRNHIDAIVTEQVSGYRWRITGFYGHPKTHKRNESWDELVALNRKFKLPWLCFGDFNEILSMSEKLGGAMRSQKQMEGFREVVNFCGFKDLGYSGPDFTWCNMQEGDSRVYLRLDRAFAMDDWIYQFNGVRVRHLIDLTFDHCALLIIDKTTRNQPRKRRFHFEAMWTKKEECKEIKKAAWEGCLNQNTPEGVVASL